MPRLTPSEKVLLGRVFQFHSKEGRLPTSSELAHTPRVRGRTVSVLQGLEAKGYISRPAPTGGASGTPWSLGHLTESGKSLGHLLSQLHDAPQRNPRRKSPYCGEGTRYPGTVTTAPGTAGVSGLRVLKHAQGNTKIGARVERGRWAGADIFGLTLEERTTCPKSCAVWKMCYGNNMPFAIRYRVAPELFEALEHDLRHLNARNRPFVVRLHVLGDFASADYALWWVHALHRFMHLRVFGYTAWARDSQIGTLLSHFPWPRAAIRFSNYAGDKRGAYVGDKRPGKSFLCPVQSGKMPTCGACTACWETQKTVRFEMH